MTKADSEQLARSIAEEQYSDLEKEKIMKELEIKDMMARHKQELVDKEATISSVRRFAVSQIQDVNFLKFQYRKYLAVMKGFYVMFTFLQQI